MKKTTCKQRKLTYIRERNRLIRGGAIFKHFKITDNSSGVDYAIKTVEGLECMLSQIYKTNIKAVKFQIAKVGADFIEDITTVKTEFKVIIDG